jgi:formamidopyrimidine-DNA glycosylase
MPELAEVELSRRVWDVALGERVVDVVVHHPKARVFREVDLDALREGLVGERYASSEARGKQLVARFGDARWLGLHLGMSGALLAEPAGYVPVRHDHLVVLCERHALVFHDPRHFGRVRYAEGADEPAWWSSIAPSVVGDGFTVDLVADFLKRRPRSPLKAVLLMQQRFPGVGNWMADEILWRARMHPSTPAGALDADGAAALWRTVRRVARLAIDTIDDNWEYPKTWLFAHRWEAGGRCPRCDAGLDRDTIGGRTTCWCPRCQPAAAKPRKPRAP